MINHIKITIKTMFQFARIETSFRLIEIIITSAMIPLSLLFTQHLINSFMSFVNYEGDFFVVIVWAIFLLISMVLMSGTGYIHSIQNINMKRKLDEGFTPEVIKRYCSLCYSCFEDSMTQNILRRVGNSPQELILNMFEDLMSALSLLISITGIIIIFSQVSLLLSLLFIIVIPVMILLDFKAMHIMNVMFKNRTKDERWLTYYSELLSGKHSLLELRVFSAVEYVIALWRDKNTKVLKDHLKTTFKAQKYFAVNNVVILLWICILIFSMLMSIREDKISLGLFVSLIGSVGSLLTVSEKLSFTFSNLVRHHLRVEDYDTFCKMPTVSTSNNTRNINLDTVKVEFMNVHFTYPNTDKEILKGVSFKFNMGEKIALVGENGSGKSTIIKLLCGLYTPDCGEIRINNININDISDKQLRKLFCPVFQDFFCYDLTLRENITLSQIDRIFDDVSVQRALKQSHAENIADNIDIPLGKIEDDGIDLSRGEWQKIAIARALFSDSIFIILDEPTASLDPITESEMYSSFGDVLNEKGCIMISHRLASAKMADKILVIRDGMICESGTHIELINKNGFYADMWNTQSSWYN